MRVVYLAEELGIGGLPNYVLQLARQARAHFSSVIVAHMGDSIGSNLETDNLEIVKLGSFADLQNLKPDLVHVHLLSNIDFLQKISSLDVPLVRSFHDYTSTCLRRGKRRWPGDRCQRALGLGCAAFGCNISPPLSGGHIPRIMSLQEKITERNLYRHFDASIAGSRHMADMLLKNGFAPDVVHTIPYFSRFSEQAKQGVTKPAGDINRPLEFLFSGQAVKGKGLEVLIDALADLEGNWRLTVFSEGPRLSAAKAKVQEQNLTDRISFKGWVSHSALADVYRSADAFILPSIWDDPGPLVGLEALSFATPVIGFAVGGIPDYVRDGETGYLVKDVSARGLLHALQLCLQNRDMLSVMGVAGQKLVSSRHSIAAHMESLKGVYENILGASSYKRVAI